MEVIFQIALPIKDRGREIKLCAWIIFSQIRMLKFSIEHLNTELLLSIIRIEEFWKVL